jgi:adenylate cyclase
MPDLIAQGPQPENRWRRKLVPLERHTIGRQAGAWSTPWDDRVSRRHVDIVLQNGELRVELLEAAKNPVFFHGITASHFNVPPGEHFVIGQTTFTLVDQRVDVSLDLPRPADERTFTVEELRSRPFHEADKRIDALARLPEIIRGSGSDSELFVRLVNLLLGGIERATAAAVVEQRSENGDTAAAPGVQVLHWDRRVLAESDFRPSERLIRQAIDCQESVAHVWSGNGPRGHGEFTLSEGIDWAFCVPVPGEACAGWGLYLTGSFSGEFSASGRPDAEQIRDDVKYSELKDTTKNGQRE